MVRHVGLLILFLSACTDGGGGNTLRETPAPELRAAPAVSLTPSADIGGVDWARAGAELTVTLDVEASEGFDAEASSVTFTGVPLELADDGVWSRTLDGEEGSGLKTLDVVLVDDLGQQARLSFDGEDTDGSGDAVQVGFDFNGPRADCVISPRESNGQQTVQVSVFANEPLPAWPALAFDFGEITATPADDDPIPDAGRSEFSWTLGFPANTNVPAYSFTATATDLVGNAQAGLDGTSLCGAAPAGERFAEGLTANDITLTVTGDAVDGDTVGTDARLEVAFAVSGGTLDPNATTVQLGDIALAYDANDDVWFDIIGPGDADGPKTLAMTLFDTVGNRTVVSDAAKKVVVDQTAPSASCTVTPQPANAASSVSLSIQPFEPLVGAPVLTATEVTVDPAVQNGARWVAPITPPADEDVTFTVGIELTDEVGNTANGDEVCVAADRTGTINGRAPLPSDVSFDITPSVPAGDGTPQARDGAVATVVLTTTDTIDPDRSFVALSGIPLASDDGTAWSALLNGTEGDGRKELFATLVDVDGNPAVLNRPDLAFIADFTPPSVASAVLQRTPFFAPADDAANDLVYFTDADPITGATVSGSLAVFADEDIASASAVQVSGPGSLGWGSASMMGRRATYPLPTVVGAAEGSYDLAVTLADALGNTSAAQTVDPRLVVDRTGPAEGPDVDSADAITYVRQPWGPSSISGGPTFQVIGEAGAVSSGGLVALENAAGQLLASGISDGDGGFDLAFGADTPEVFVRSFDKAGNPSPKSGVRDVAWTATLAGKVLGSNLGNPHGLVSTTMAGEGLKPLPFADTEAQDELPLGSVEPLRWLRSGVTALGAIPPARDAHALAYDAARGVAVLFGGRGTAPGACSTPGSEFCSDTWEWDGTTWTEVTPATSPPARGTHTLAYDAARGVTVLFGGIDEMGQLLADTWEWDGTTWTEVTPATSPPARYSHALAYDATRGVTVLFGGYHEMGQLLADTWEWDGTTWTEVTPATSPPARFAHALAYDAARQVTVLFGGGGSAPGACGAPGSFGCPDTWEWDGTTWTDVTPATSPPARATHTLAYDAARGVTVLFGGNGPAAGVCGRSGEQECSDTWEWDGTTWNEVTPATSPPARFAHALAYDTARGVALVFGGLGNSATLSDTWEWDGTTWTEVKAAISPAARSLHALAHDAARRATVLFGGLDASDGACGPPGSGLCSDTWEWEWDGTTWTDVTPATSPPARFAHALAYDASRGVTVLFGGNAIGSSPGACGTPDSTVCSDTWEWDGTMWTNVTPATSPPARFAHALAYDAARGTTVLFGGLDASDGACGPPGSGLCSDTWEWDGTTWNEVTPAASPPARATHALAYDAAREVTVLFGGLATGSGVCAAPDSSFCSDTWEWDGTTWTEVTLAASPPGRESAALAYDASRGTTVLFGGFGATGTVCGSPGSSICSDTWEWDGTTWAELTTTASPPGRGYHALAYDAARGVAVLFGGENTENSGGCGMPGSDQCSDTWLLPSDRTSSPRHTFTPAFGAAQAPDATLLTVSARWVAGGSGTPGGTRETGAELMVWSGVSWTVLDSHTADEHNATELCARIVADTTAPPDPGCTDLVDPALVRNLFRFGPDLTSTFAVRPTAPIGTDVGALRSEDVSVTVRYRLPPED